MKYNNIDNIPLALAVFLAYDDYDYHKDSISATTLIKPLRQIILSRRLDYENAVMDLSGTIATSIGSAIHTGIEKAWQNPIKALEKLGYSKQYISRIKINPKHVNKEDIAIYMEQRCFKKVDGKTISGKFDFVYNGQVQDFKTTSVYTYLNQSNKDKYILQGSIYRFLNPDIITKDTMQIHYIFTDHSKQQALQKKQYPKHKIHSQTLPLLSLEDTERFIKQKLANIKQYENTDEKDIPFCTDEELWRRPTIYKYFKNKNALRATKNFNNRHDAMVRYIEDGSVGKVVEVKGQVVACKYCPAFNMCTQKDAYIANKTLILE